MIASNAPRKQTIVPALLSGAVEAARQQNPALARLLRSAVKEYSAKMAKINAVSF